MTPQEAYNKGLTDAETIVIENLKKLIENQKMDEFNNPELEKIRLSLFVLVDTLYGLSKNKNVVGKYCKKQINESLTFLN